MFEEPHDLIPGYGKGSYRSDGLGMRSKSLHTNVKLQKAQV